MTDTFGFLVFTFIAILLFEAVNGWTDAPNAIATVVSTRVLPPMVAVSMAAVLNLVGALSGTAVATTIGKGLVDIDQGLTLETAAAGALAVVIWSSLAAYFGLPTSESHGIVSGLAGAAVAVAGLDVLIVGGWEKVFFGVGTAVFFGFIGAFVLMVAVLWLFQKTNPSSVRRLFGPLQVVSSAFMAWSHGTADGQKAIGVMAMALAIYNETPSSEFEVPLWVIFLGAGTLGVSTMAGGWRIIRTLGMRVTQLETYQGFCAEAAAATTLTVTARFGIPLSTTHTIGSAIMGVGATRRLSAVRWGIAYNILTAWVLTFPVCFGLGYLIATIIPD
ncbi:MAG TPA: inorganic phosphate transporter [Dehalococcoidia bacterium]|nr:inorganic phosphate transporter [Dehalococcoidia bacterium]